MLRFLFIILSLLACLSILSAQNRLYPFRENNQYGLIDKDGQTVVSAKYAYISAFSSSGYAIVQGQNDQLGIIDSTGTFTVHPQYEYLNFADNGLFSVKVGDNWKIITPYNKVLFDSIPGKIKQLSPNYISFSVISGKGLIHLQKGTIIPPHYSYFELKPNSYIFAYDNLKRIALFDTSGQRVLSASYEIIRFHKQLIWCFNDGKWMAFNRKGQAMKLPNCKRYKPLNDELYGIYHKQEAMLFSSRLNKIIFRGVKRLIPTRGDVVLFENNNGKMGVVDGQGQVILEPIYDRITQMDSLYFRITEKDKVGVVDRTGRRIIASKYDHVTRFDESVALVRIEKKYGVVNKQGRLVIPVVLTKYPELNANSLRYKNKKNELQIIRFNAQGEVQQDLRYTNLRSLKIKRTGRRSFGRPSSSTTSNANNANQISDSLIWRFHGNSRKWGLWHITEERWKFPPSYNSVEVRKDLGFTIVGWNKQDIGGRIQTGMVDLKIHRVYGFFNNKHGLPVTRMHFTDIRLTDFTVKNLPVARVIFVGGRHGLMLRNCKVIKKGLVFIGEFKEGKARCTRKGRLQVDLDNKIKRPLAKASSFFGSFRSNYSFDQDNDPRYFDPFKDIGQVYCKDAKWGYIDTLGEMVVDYKFDLVENYSNNRAMVKLDGHWGMLDQDGNEVLATQYDDFDFLPNSNNQLFYIAQHIRLHGAIDSNGKIIVPVKYTKVRDFNNKRVAVRNVYNRWGFVNQKSEEVIPCQYRQANDFSEGLAVVYKKGRWGAIDLAGQEVIKPQYARMGDFHEGKAWVYLPKGFKGYIDKQGKVVFKGRFTRLRDFDGGVAWVYISKKGWGLIDTKGEYVMRPKKRIRRVAAFDKYGLAKVRIGNKYRLINRAGDFVGNSAYGLIRDFHEGYAVVRKQALTGNIIGKVNLKFTFIDTNGVEIPKQEFNQLQDFSGGRAAFRGENGQRGYIDTKGDIAIAPQYFKVEPFRNNRAVVYKQYNISGVIDTTGKEIIPVAYDRIVETGEGLALVRKNSWTYFFVHEDTKRHTPVNFHDAIGFQHGIAPVRMGQHWGLVNHKGIQALTPKYADIKPFDQGVAKVSINKMRGVVDIDGNVVIRPKYEYVSYVGDGLFQIEQGDLMGYLNLDGKWVRPLGK